MKQTYTKNDHTFVVCAYKESAHLYECIDSLMNQTERGKIMIATSTPSDFLQNAAAKYGIELRVNSAPPSISGDWNFALRQATSPLVTLAHQDDVYAPDYLETCLRRLNRATNPIIFFSHYGELRNGERCYNNKLLGVKKLMLKPLKAFPRSKFIRRRVLSMGNPICCPAVTYVRSSGKSDKSGEFPEFTNEFKTSLDWCQWELLSQRKGSFVYCETQLMFHRIHEESETTKTIGESVRSKEDFEMFKKFWPTWIAKRLLKFYSASEDSNKL